MRRPTLLLAILLVPAAAHGACNLIPSATQTFRGSLGATNKPYAAPGDFVEVAVQTDGCDGASPGLQAPATNYDVTIVFTPPGKGQRRVVFLTANCAAAAGKKTTCEAVNGIGTGNVACVDADAALDLVTRNGVPHLSFRFPDTDAFRPPAGDRRTFSGPATVAVTRTVDPLPCDLAARPCSATSGVVACVDDLYGSDGTCAPNLHPTFTHFTALPVPNDYQAACFADSPCTALATETRAGVDAAGNLLIPVNWQGTPRQCCERPGAAHPAGHAPEPDPVPESTGREPRFVHAGRRAAPADLRAEGGSDDQRSGRDLPLRQRRRGVHHPAYRARARQLRRGSEHRRGLHR